MKIGILTFHRAYNFGAFLQAYALKSFLEQNGNDVSFIDYWPYGHENMYNSRENGGIKTFVRNLLVLKNRLPRYIRFRKAQRKYLGIASKPMFRTGEQLETVEYDVIIYGSDQIWWKSKITDNKFDRVYWGQYIRNNVKKIAYAASMGIINLTENDKLEIANYLKSFSDIFVRETQLMNVLQPMTEKPIRTVLDPTLLLPASFWEAFCSRQKKVNGKYIFYYKMLGDPKADIFAREIGRIHKLPVITVLGNISTYKANRISSLTDPARFTALIRDAEYVVSTSFHGVAMSIQFKKEFYAMGMKNNTDRVLSLLTQLGLENRLTDVVPDDFSETIDYSEVYSRLLSLRQESAECLISSIRL